MPRNTRAAARAGDDTTLNAPQTAENTTEQVRSEVAEPVNPSHVKTGKNKRGKSRKERKTIVVDDVAVAEAIAEEIPPTNSVEKQLAPPEDQPIPPSPLRRSNRRKGQEPVISADVGVEPQIALDIPSEQLAPSPEPEMDSPVETKDLLQASNDEKDQLEVAPAPTSDAVQELESIFQRPAEADDAEDDSAISDIINKTPAKPTPSPRRKAREDPIEALDALEDALDEVGKFLPNMTKVSKKRSSAPPLERQQSAKTTVSAPAKASAKTTNRSNAKFSNGAPNVRKQALSKTETAKILESLQTTTFAKSVSKRTSVAPHQPVPSKASTANSRPRNMQSLPSTRVSPTQTATTTTPKVATNVKQRTAIAALHTPPPAVKSTKPLTKPVFQLPGELMAAKLKAQREARIKRQEAAAASAAENKVRPLNKPTATQVRQLAASAARKSILTERNKNSDDGARGMSASSTKQTLAPASRTLSVAPRLSTMSSRPKSMVLSSSTRRSAAETRSRPVSIHGSQALSSTARPRAAMPGDSTSKPPVRTASVSGKEVANRAKLEQKSREQEVKDKAEAARKARAEAAERGRQASREWAEKMRQKAAPNPAARLASIAV